MPLYNLACRDALDVEARRNVAQTVTAVHCRVTGAPAEFVNVVFVDGYPLPAPQTVSLLGGVRTGGNRTAEIVDELRAALQAEIAGALQQAEDTVGISLIGVPSNWIVEGGEIMPEPGEETAWLERKHAPKL